MRSVLCLLLLLAALVWANGLQNEEEFSSLSRHSFAAGDLIEDAALRGEVFDNDNDDSERSAMGFVSDGNGSSDRRQMGFVGDEQPRKRRKPAAPSAPAPAPIRTVKPVVKKEQKPAAAAAAVVVPEIVNKHVTVIRLKDPARRYQRKLKALTRRIRKQIRRKKVLTRRKQTKRVKRKLKRCDEVLKAMVKKHAAIRRLIDWARVHRNDFEYLSALRLPRSLKMRKKKNDSWRPYLSRRLGLMPGERSPGKQAAADQLLPDPNRVAKRRVRAEEKKIRKKEKKNKRFNLKERKNMSVRRKEKQRAKERRQRRRIRREAKRVKKQLRKRDKKRRMADKKFEQRKALARLAKKQNQEKRDKILSKKTSAKLKIVNPESKPIAGVRVGQAYSMHPVGHNRDATNSKFRRYSDVRRMVDGNVRTLWRFRTGGSKNFGVLLKLPSPHTVTGVDIYVPELKEFSTGYAGVRVFVKDGNTWRRVSQACGMFGKFDRNAIDVCGTANPKVAPSFKFNKWNQNRFERVRGVSEIRLVFGTADQGRDHCVSLGEVRVLGYPTSGNIGRQILPKKQIACPLGEACNPATSCKEIKQRRASPESAPYHIRYEGKVYQVYCDMKSHGGGWTSIINPSFLQSQGLPLHATAVQSAGNVNSCGTKYYRDTLYGFHRLKGYACGNARVDWTISWKNSLGAHEVMIAGAIQGHDMRSITINGRSIGYKGQTGTDNNYCAFINGWNASVRPAVNNCFNLDYSTSAPRYLKLGKIGPNLIVRIQSGLACHPNCKYGTGFNLQQLYVR